MNKILSNGKNLISIFSNNIEGYFLDSDFEFYNRAYNSMPEKATIVELGSWKGRSSSFMATLIANGNKNIKFYCIDTWEGSNEDTQQKDLDIINHTLFDTFTNNMKPVEGFYIPVCAASPGAANLFENESLDMIFIDAGHTYDDVITDINAWLPKIKKGGLISGHDYPHPPVQKAVNELLGNVNTLGYCWFKIKE